ncbi:hypothetical protein [Amycolatopsis saalfeldensis]|uniref:Uncharacterized protein n=1 Tax=Amycolatopsis saalfeldensis TaxID=394193 RepID=A0A1H8RBC0_9PSEU|nr:hypothetical protein [Amycolatopsis saalfeldensis]SEO63819.1 hypothetical protein SAMN04489732_101718 [Amycolatopsis saalfeldensis]
MTVKSHRPVEDAVAEVGLWLTGEFSGRLPASAVAEVLRVTRRDLEGRIAPEDLGEMLHRMSRTRLQRLLANDVRGPGVRHRSGRSVG